MSVIPHPTMGPGWWYVIYYPEGKKGGPKYVPVQGTEAKAKIYEAELRTQNRKEKISLYPRLNEAAPDFIMSYKLDHQPKGVERTVISLKELLKHFGKYQFTQITNTLVEGYKSKRLADGVKPTTINKELAALSSFCKWANERHYCQPIKIKRFPPKLTKAPLPDIPAKDEIEKLINAIPWEKRGLYASMYYAGLRSEEAKTLKAENVNQAHHVLIVTGKGNKQRIVPLIEPLKTMIYKRVDEIKTGYLWPGPKGEPLKDLRPTIKWACKRAKITRKYNPHLFRHAFGAHGTEAGIGLRALQVIMGHSTSAITEIYTQLAAAGLAKEMKKF